MYKIVVAEDEPAALNHVCMVLEKKCPGYEIIGTAPNGVKALELIAIEPPDILISDVKMPLMDGIQLVSTVKAKYPEILSVIVSGYSDFDYAKQALRSGVCDYLLKPLSPSDMKNLMERLTHRLDALYYGKRNKMLRMLCNGREPKEGEKPDRYFPKGRYFAALYRKNGLPKRFSRKTGVEIFSMEEEKIFIYGRDEMEALYLIPESLLFQGGIKEMAERIFQKEKGGYAYVTAILCEFPFYLSGFPEIVKKLYRRLDESIVIGKNQMLLLESKAAVSPAEDENQRIPKTEEEKNQMGNIEQLIRYQDTGKLPKELLKIFLLWDRQKRSQIYVESSVNYLFSLIRNVYPSESNFSDLEFMLDDAFSYAMNMQELSESLLNLLKQCMPKLGEEKIDNKEQLFRSITAFLNSHLGEEMTLGGICRQFGVSQTSLSRMFRFYESTSFSNYLTMIRIEKAKKMMGQEPDAYIRDIAEQCGYSDQFYFSRIFRSVTGVCPKEYMESK